MNVFTWFVHLVHFFLSRVKEIQLNQRSCFHNIVQTAGQIGRKCNMSGAGVITEVRTVYSRRENALKMTRWHYGARHCLTSESTEAQKNELESDWSVHRWVAAGTRRCHCTPALHYSLAPPQMKHAHCRDMLDILM